MGTQLTFDELMAHHGLQGTRRRASKPVGDLPGEAPHDPAATYRSAAERATTATNFCDHTDRLSAHSDAALLHTQAAEYARRAGLVELAGMHAARAAEHMRTMQEKTGGKHAPGTRAFSDLAIGDVFRFAAEGQPGMSQLKRGPWRKTSTRKYAHAEYGGVENTIGTVKAKVVLEMTPSAPAAPIPPGVPATTQEAYRAADSEALRATGIANESTTLSRQAGKAHALEAHRKAYRAHEQAARAHDAAQSIALTKQQIAAHRTQATAHRDVAAQHADMVRKLKDQPPTAMPTRGPGEWRGYDLQRGMMVRAIAADGTHTAKGRVLAVQQIGSEWRITLRFKNRDEEFWTPAHTFSSK